VAETTRPWRPISLQTTSIRTPMIVWPWEDKSAITVTCGPKLPWKIRSLQREVLATEVHSLSKSTLWSKSNIPIRQETRDQELRKKRRNTDRPLGKRGCHNCPDKVLTNRP
jgi:hypothetical protein